MSIMYCPDCHKKISTSARACPFCGKTWVVGEGNEFYAGFIIMAIAVAIIGPIGVGVYNYVGKRNRAENDRKVAIADAAFEAKIQKWNNILKGKTITGKKVEKGNTYVGFVEAEGKKHKVRFGMSGDFQPHYFVVVGAVTNGEGDVIDVLAYEPNR